MPAAPCLPCSEWVERFTVHTFVLGLSVEPDAISTIAHELYSTLGHLPPEDAALSDWDDWLNDDDAPTSGPGAL